MDRVQCEVDPASTFPRHYSGEVRVTLESGQVLRHREAVNRGHAERPLSNADVQRKFLGHNATLHFSAAHAAAVQSQFLALPQLADVNTLETLLAQDPVEQPKANP